MRVALVRLIYADPYLTLDTLSMPAVFVVKAGEGCVLKAKQTDDFAIWYSRMPGELVHVDAYVNADPNYAQPWQMRPQRSSSGSAFIVDTRRRHIMTNAHVVSFTSARHSGLSLSQQVCIASMCRYQTKPLYMYEGLGIPKNGAQRCFVRARLPI